MTSITITLPVPPPLSRMFVNVPGRGRVKTRLYRQWRREAGWTLKAQHPGRVTGAYAVITRLPMSTRGDVDNRQKAVLDLLVEHKVTPDDRHCRRTTIERAPGITEAVVTVVPWEVA